MGVRAVETITASAMVSILLARLDRARVADPGELTRRVHRTTGRAAGGDAPGLAPCRRPRYNRACVARVRGALPMSSAAKGDAMKELARHIMVDFLPMKDFAENPLILTEGRGIYVTDVDGRRFIDGLSGTFCVNLGHGNRRLAEAASRQIERLALAAPTLGTSDRALELVKLLLDITPPQYTTVKLLSGGSEVTEAAIKMARQYWKQVGRGTKYKILSHYRGYHGGTGHALAAGGWPGWRAPYEPLAGGFIHLHTPDPYRPPFPGGPETLGATYARLLEEVIQLEGPETIAALITEPVMTSAGVVVPPREYLPRVRELCDRHDILLIYDEIITGFGRTGKLFAAEHWNAWPDIFCLGKGISGGYAPLSANLLTTKIGEVFYGSAVDQVQFHAGHTFGGNPVASAVGIAAIRQILDDGIVENSRARGAQATGAPPRDAGPPAGDRGRARRGAPARRRVRP